MSECCQEESRDVFPKHCQTEVNHTHIYMEIIYIWVRCVYDIWHATRCKPKLTPRAHLEFQDVATRRTAAEGVLSKAEQLLHLPQMVWSGASIAKIPFFSGIWMDFGGKNRQNIFEILGFAQKNGGVHHQTCGFHQQTLDVTH